MDVIIYTRISSKPQHDGVSLEIQEETCKRWASDNRMRLRCVVYETGSAYQDGNTQPALKKAMSSLGRGGLLIVTTADRFSRNVAKAEEWIRMLHRKHCTLVVCNQGGRALFSDNENDLAIIMHYIEVGQSESEVKSQRVKSTRQYLIENALPDFPYFPGIPPMGYEQVQVRATAGYIYRSIRVNDEEMGLMWEVARRIFHRTEDEPLNEVINEVSTELSQEGVTRRGEMWAPHRLKQDYLHYLDNIKCTRCKKDGEGEMMLCETCMSGIHVHCFGRRRRIPERYICTECLNGEATVAVERIRLRV